MYFFFYLFGLIAETRITYEWNTHIAIGKEGLRFRLTAADFLNKSLLTTLFDNSARPARLPLEERAEMMTKKGGRHAGPA